MAQVRVVGAPGRVLFEGPAEEAHAFKNQHEPRPHSVDGKETWQLEVVGDESPAAEESQEEL